MRTQIGHRFLIDFANMGKVFGTMLLFLFLSFQIQAQSFPTRENQVKAVFLFNFTQFVEWSSSAFNSVESPFVIGILGEDPFGSYLDETVEGEMMMGHPLVIQRYKTVKNLQDCHILFIGADEVKRIKDIRPVLAKRNTLTVSDADNFASEGGMIRFFTKENKTKLQINLSAVKAANLDISSKLLRLAEIIE